MRRSAMAPTQLSALLRAALLAACLASAASSLRFRADGTFKVVQFTDLHFGESEALDAKSQEVQQCAPRPPQRVLESEC